MRYQRLLGPHSRWFGYLQSLPRETVAIAVFWGVNDAIETRTCTCSARGCLSTNDTSSAADEQRQTTLSKCPWCIWLHDNRHAREWLEATEVDHEQLGLVVSPKTLFWFILLCLLLRFLSPSLRLLLSPAFVCWLLRDQWVLGQDLCPSQLLAMTCQSMVTFISLVPSL